MEKLAVTLLDRNGSLRHDTRFDVLFNPTSYSVSKSVSWTAASGTGMNAPALSFTGGNSRTLQLELFYDVTEMVTVGGVPRLTDDVRAETSRMVALTRFDGGDTEPPVVEVSWGGAGPGISDFPFRGVVSSLTQNFTLFSSAGKPLRATLSVSFTEFLVKQTSQKTSSFDWASVVVGSGDRLDAIAAARYNDPAQWRRVAQANKLDDPRRLPIGSRLTIPGS